MIKAELKRLTRSGQFCIEVTFPNGDTDQLWDMIVEHCSKTLSNNELKSVYDQCNNQLQKMNPDDVPQMFHELMAELRQTIIHRKLFDADQK